MLDTYISLAHTFTVLILRCRSAKMLSILLVHKREYCSPFVMHCPSQDVALAHICVACMVGASVAPDTHVKITSQPRAWTLFRGAEAANANARKRTHAKPNARRRAQTQNAFYAWVDREFERV